METEKEHQPRQAVTELIIGGNIIPYVVPAAEISTTCCMLLVPNSHSVTVCRNALMAVLRWFLVLPAFAAAYCAGIFIWYVTTVVGMSCAPRFLIMPEDIDALRSFCAAVDMDGRYVSGTIWMLLRNGTASFVAVYIGMRVSPRGEIAVGWLLYALFVCWFALLLSVAIASGAATQMPFGVAYRAILEAIAITLGAVAAIRSQREKEPAEPATAPYSEPAARSPQR
ncbi:MAG: hypothetical protein V1749_00220 [Candidatus Desantisbacteria bacterium]